MEKIQFFIVDNYTYIIFSVVILLMILIGYIADKTNYIRSNKTEKSNKNDLLNETKELEENISNENKNLLEKNISDVEENALNDVDENQIQDVILKSNEEDNMTENIIPDKKNVLKGLDSDELEHHFSNNN